MSGARVQNIDVIRQFRASLIKFADAAKVALGDSESEVQRTAAWLASEQPRYWESQIRKRHEKVNQCKDAVRQKKLYKDSTGKTQSAVDEEKQLRIAQARLAEAEQKLLNTKRHSGKMQKELHMYKGATQTFATNLGLDVPNAIAALDRMMQALDGYVSLTASAGSEEATGAPASTGSVGSGEGNTMTRSDVEALATEVPAEQSTEEVAASEVENKGETTPP